MYHTIQDICFERHLQPKFRSVVELNFLPLLNHGHLCWNEETWQNQDLNLKIMTNLEEKKTHIS